MDRFLTQYEGIALDFIFGLLGESRFNHTQNALGTKYKYTGLLPSTERQTRIANLVAEPGEYALVCTDCLLEGVNLQDHFNAVLHYNLAWNPTRHEQREGRVDRFGQEKTEVRVVTYYGTDNPIDGVILEVLLRKHKKIKSDLGVTVAIPGSSEQIAETLFEGALFKERTRAHPQQMSLDFIDDLGPKKKAIHAEWDNARDREKASRSRFAQHTFNPEAVAVELQAVRSAIGSHDDVARFFHSALRAANVPIPSPATGLPQLPEPPFRRAVPSTPADQAGARVDCFPAYAAFPKWQEGRHPHCHFRGLLRLHSRYGPPDCLAA
jgi:hypothetical protein